MVLLSIVSLKLADVFSLMPHKLIYSLGLCCFLISCRSSGDRHVEAGKALPETVDFNFHIKPILSDRCFKCHGPDNNTREANLRFDVRESALQKPLEEGGYAFVPGSKHRSIAYTRMTSDDPELMMPPPDAQLELSAYEIALIGKWIEQGAQYKKHWSFIPPKKVDLPKVANTSWPQNEIDHFVLAKLEGNGMNPSGAADEALLLRRLHLDLIGLPPEPPQIDAFLASTDPNKIEKTIDQLLASPHYGERMALDWMDVARYADSHGYSQDGSRIMYPWRDWVIKAFNENMPYDQFILWQMAGDLIPESNKESKLATAFLRNHRINAEGGIIPEEYRVEYVSDRSHTTATAFLGLTMECARCHDHKYDPISQKEYYQFFGFFNQTNEQGQGTPDGNTGPEVYLSDEEIEEQISYLDQQIARQEEKFGLRVRQAMGKTVTANSTAVKEELDKGLICNVNFEEDFKIRKGKKSLKNLSKSDPLPVRGEPEILTRDQRRALKAGAYDGVTIPSSLVDFPRAQPFSFAFWLQAHPETDFMEVLHRMGSKYRGQNGYDIALKEGHIHMRIAHSLPSNLMEVKMRTPLPKEKWTHLTITYDGSGKASGIQFYMQGNEVACDVLYDQLERSITHSADLTVGGSIHLDENVDDGHFYIDDLRVYAKALTSAEVALIHNEATNLTEEQIRHHLALRRDTKVQVASDSLQHYRHLRNDLENGSLGVMVMQDVPSPRPTFILNRGQYDAPMEEVSMGTPLSIKPFAQELPANRLGLAKWLIDADHPLTARVTVNRLWQQLFGRGIVGTVEDFGSQGALPSHPELLDWLSVSLVEKGWDLKAILKYITMSATYQQSSIVSAKERQEDPENTWLARGASFRLSAELLRDNMLAASGLLQDSIGGPSVKPYQPEGLWDEKTSFTKDLAHYDQDHGPDLYRRSLYTFWRRTSHHPVMSIFDAPTRDNCTVRRQMSNTPLQALAMMNETQFVESARVLAERVMTTKSIRTEQISTAHQLLSGCVPNEESLSLLLELFAQEETHFRNHLDQASSLLSTGEHPNQHVLDRAEHAAMTIVCNTIMNFDEVVTKR